MSDRIDALERRLQALEDVAAIKDLKIHYWQSLDRRRFEAVRACLAADVHIEMEGVPCHTRDEFIDFIGRAGGRTGSFNQHAGQNPRITLIGTDRAEGIWDMWFTSVDVGARLTIQMTGEYHDIYVRSGGHWLIAAQRFRQTSFLMSAIDAQGGSRITSMGRDNSAAFGA